MARSLVIAFFLLLGVISASGQSVGTARSARSLAANLSSDTQPTADFDITASVRFVNADKNNWIIAIEDKTGHVIIFDQCGIIRYIPNPGDVIRCSGFTAPHHPGKVAIVTNTQFIARGAPKQPVPARIAALLDGTFDHQYVLVSGTVYDARTSETNPDWTLLTLAENDKVINASVMTGPLAASVRTRLVGSDIRINGVCLPHELGPRTYLGKSIKAYGLSSIEVMRRPDDNWQKVPDLGTLTVLCADAIPAFRHYRASGIVIAQWNRDVLIETDDSTVVRVTFVSESRPAVGQCIEVIGFPETDLFNLSLSQAIWRKCDRRHTASVREPMPLDKVPDSYGDFRLHAKYHGKTLSISGVVLTLPSPDDDDGKLYIANDNHPMPVFVDPSWEIVSALKVGSRVEIVGTGVLEAERWHPNLVYPKAIGFFIVTRTPHDIRIVRHPSWWNTQRLLTLVGALTAVLIGILVWNLALRRLATRKGRELFREQLGHVKADLRTEERTRLAVELHDTLAQNLTGVSMEIEAANDLRGNAPKPMLDHLDIAAKALKSCRDELRNCLWDLRSQALEEADMTKAVLKTLQPVVNDSRLAVRFNVPRARLSDNTAHALLRVIRELVVNAIRHGNASAIKVAGTIDCGKLLCSVTDDGCGFDPDAAPGILQGHFGLQGVQERVDEIGGTFDISSEIGRGTKAVITLTALTEEQQ